MKEIEGKTIVALVPCYTGEGANFTKLILVNTEEIVLKKNITTSIRNLCSFYHFDLKSSNKTSKEILGISKSPPIAIKEDLVLIAVKTRFPIGKDDGAYSYINTTMIKGVKTGGIDFKDGSSLSVLSSKKTIEKNIKYAHILKETILGRGKQETNYGISFNDNDIYGYESRPNIAISRHKSQINLVRERGRDLCYDDCEEIKKDLEILYKKIESIQACLLK